MVRDRLQEIIIKPFRVYGTFFTVEDKSVDEFPYDNVITEWELPFEQIEQYNVIFRNIIIGTFWISNIAKSSIHMFVPTDIEIWNYIIWEIKVREFVNNTINP